MKPYLWKILYQKKQTKTYHQYREKRVLSTKLTNLKVTLYRTHKQSSQNKTKQKTMGYKKTATKKNKEKKKDRVPIVRSSAGQPYLGVRTDPDVMRHQDSPFAGKKPTINNNWDKDSIDKYLEIANSQNKKGMRKKKKSNVIDCGIKPEELLI